MKIGILTLPLNTNYGGILQAYALQTVLERLGHEAYLIEMRRRKLRMPIWKAPFAYAKRIFRNIRGQRWPIFYEQKLNVEMPIIRQHTDKFISKYLKRKVYGNFSDIKETDYDAIIVGSDQIFRAAFLHKDIVHSYLDFAVGWNIKRIAYAASFGTKEWEYSKKQTIECGKLIKLFNAVSVREASGIILCSKYFGIKAEHVLDPTLLLDRVDYVELFKATNTPRSQGNLLCYILDKTIEKNCIIDEIAKGLNLIPFNVKSESDLVSDLLVKRIQPPMEQWLRGFYDAEYVVTDSFHACVFSILFKKPFIVIANERRGLARIMSLLTVFGLEDRLVLQGKHGVNLSGIDYDKVYQKLQVLREESRCFLKVNLSNTEQK